MSFNLAQPVLITNASSNVDFNYGVYNSVAEANAAVIGGLRALGRTVGILESGSVVEYWWESGILDADLVPKGGQSEWGAITGTLSNQTDLQNALDEKQATITGAATTIDTEDLTASRALVSDANGKVAVSDVTATELSYLDGVTSAVQTQIDDRLEKYDTQYPVGSNKNIFGVVALNQSEFDALNPDANTLYFIV